MGISGENVDPKFAGWPETEKLYLHDMPLKDCTNLLADFDVPLPAFRDILQRNPDIATASQLFALGFVDYWPSLFIGGGKTQSRLHTDTYCLAGWQLLLDGTKHWAVVHPENDEALAPHIHLPELDILRLHAERRLDPSIRCWEGVIGAGDMVVFSGCSPHQVKNLGGKPTLAVAGNFLDESSMTRFLRKVRRKVLLEQRYIRRLEHHQIWNATSYTAFGSVTLANTTFEDDRYLALVDAMWKRVSEHPDAKREFRESIGRYSTSFERFKKLAEHQSWASLGAGVAELRDVDGKAQGLRRN